jgi:MauM/NapG family ferredoxin protein
MKGRDDRKRWRFHPWHGPWRTIIPALFTLAVIVLFFRLSYPLPGDSDWLLRLSRLDPVLSLSQLRRWAPGQVGAHPAVGWGAAGAAVPAWIWLPLGVLLVSAALGRVFCGWICPVGGLLAVLQSARDFLSRRKPVSPARKGKPGSPAGGGALDSPAGKGNPGISLSKGTPGSTSGNPVSKGTPGGPVRAGAPSSSVGKDTPGAPVRAGAPNGAGAPGSIRYFWLVFLIFLLSLGVGWPLLLTPYALLGHEAVRLWSLHLPWLLAAALALGILVFPRAWCVYVCPTGLLLSAVGSLRRWRLTAGPGCDRCGRCLSVCPVRAATPGGAAGEQCILCGRCYETCPQGAIHLTGRKNIRLKPAAARPVRERGDDSGAAPSRRSFLKGAAAILAAGGLWLYLGRQAYAQPLRPPGAVPEAEFLARCARCGRCIKVCPNQALQPLSLLSGLAALDTPCLAPRQGRCEMCLLCQEVCPTGAIRRLPVDQVKIGTAAIDHRRCLAWGQGKYCLVCVEQCPFQAAVMDEQQRPVIRADRCKGCGACENACPVPGAAVHVYPIQQ